MTTIAQIGSRRVTVGVDTHLELHVAAAKDELGRDLGTASFPATSLGYAQLLAWAGGLGELERVGVEGTGSYGAGLSRFLRQAGVAVVEVSRPNRQERRRHGKSDPADAVAACRAVLSGEALGVPKSADATVEMVRVLRATRRGAMKARTQAVLTMRALLVTAPAALRDELGKLSLAALVKRCAAMRPGAVATPVAAAKLALRSLARRIVALDEELAELDSELVALTAKAAPELVATFGVGADVAGALLVAVGDNPERLASEAAFAKMCGVSPIEASSGKTARHRLNRGGDRQANAALYRIVVVRMRYHEPTKAYIARRIAEGKTKKEAIRCLKRYVAREVYQILTGARHKVLEQQAA